MFSGTALVFKQFAIPTQFTSGGAYLAFGWIIRFTCQSPCAYTEIIIYASSSLYLKRYAITHTLFYVVYLQASKKSSYGYEDDEENDDSSETDFDDDEDPDAIEVPGKVSLWHL